MLNLEPDKLPRSWSAGCVANWNHVQHTCRDTLSDVQVSAQYNVNIKSFPSYKTHTTQESTDLHCLSSQADTSLHCEVTTDMRPVHHAMCLFTSQLSMQIIAPTCKRMARLSWSGWLVTRRDDLPAGRWSSIQVLMWKPGNIQTQIVGHYLSRSCVHHWRRENGHDCRLGVKDSVIHQSLMLTYSPWQWHIIVLCPSTFKPQPKLQQ